MNNQACVLSYAANRPLYAFMLMGTAVSLVDIATRYELDRSGFNPGGDEIFRTRSDRNRGPTQCSQHLLKRLFRRV